MPGLVPERLGRHGLIHQKKRSAPALECRADLREIHPGRFPGEGQAHHVLLGDFRQRRPCGGHGVVPRRRREFIILWPRQGQELGRAAVLRQCHGEKAVDAGLVKAPPHGHPRPAVPGLPGAKGHLRFVDVPQRQVM